MRKEIVEMPEECKYCGHDFIDNPEDWMGELGYDCCTDCVATDILDKGDVVAEQ